MQIKGIFSLTALSGKKMRIQFSFCVHSQLVNAKWVYIALMRACCSLKLLRTTLFISPGLCIWCELSTDHSQPFKDNIPWIIEDECLYGTSLMARDVGPIPCGWSMADYILGVYSHGRPLFDVPEDGCWCWRLGKRILFTFFHHHVLRFGWSCGQQRNYLTFVFPNPSGVLPMGTWRLYIGVFGMHLPFWDHLVQ